jgi:sulfite reductase (NADPH) flavoprotein alpha-component
MGDAVHETLIQIVAQQGRMSREESEAYLRNMSDNHKYQSDVFD